MPGAPRVPASSTVTALMGRIRPVKPDTVFSSHRHRKPQPEWYVHAFRFIIVNGLRRGECAGIREEDIHAGVLTIQRSINRLGEITDGKTQIAILKACEILKNR